MEQQPAPPMSAGKPMSTLLQSMQDPRYLGQYGQSQYSTAFHSGGNLPIFERVRTTQTQRRVSGGDATGKNSLLFKNAQMQLKDLGGKIGAYNTPGNAG